MSNIIPKLILGVIIFSTFTSIVSAEFDPFPQNKDSIYYYDNENDVPEVCFFGEGARWDGYKVTTANWNKLTDYQKTMFISEGVEAIERNENVEVEWHGGWDLLIALNGGVASLKEQGEGMNVLMIRFLINTLNDIGYLRS